MLPSKASLDVVVVVGIIAGLIACGWVARGWKDDAAQLETERAQAKAYAARIERFDQSAQNTLVALQDAGQKREVVRREIVRNVVEYRDRPCLEPAAVGLLNDIAAGAGADRPAGDVPVEPAAAP